MLISSRLGHAIPPTPQYNITNLSFTELNLPDGRHGLSARVGLRVANDYPLDFTVPPLGFAILVPNCAPSDPYIMLADATTGSIHVKPKENLSLNVTGFIRRLPDALIAACPDSHESPLDALLGDYINGQSSSVAQILLLSTLLSGSQTSYPKSPYQYRSRGIRSGTSSASSILPTSVSAYRTTMPNQARQKPSREFRPK